ncbi:hypothetical protein ACX4MT_00050 [Roseomonas mucosa]
MRTASKRCWKCGASADYQDGIGLFCPNPACIVLDGIGLTEEEGRAWEAQNPAIVEGLENRFASLPTVAPHLPELEAEAAAEDKILLWKML